MKIKLTGISEGLISAWKQYFIKSEQVEILHEDITIQNVEAIVSPANSFGFMDGGLDYALSVRFGWDLEKKLQSKIRELPEQELLVGKALLIETGDDIVPFLISAPTMRIPTNFGIPTSINAYLAMKAILILCKRKKIESVAIPGLCTGVGGMKPLTSAHQMFVAYDEIVMGNRPDFTEFGQAQKYQWNMNKDSMIWTH